MLFKGLDVLRLMDDGSGIKLHSDMAKKAACHFAKQVFDDVEPRAMPGRQDALKTVGARREKPAR